VGSRFWPEVFAGGKDQAKSTKLPWDPDRDYYDLAKRTQHGFNYMLTAHGFSRNSKVPLSMAKELRDQYFSFVPEISEWHRWVGNEIRTKHQLVSPMGRKRIFLGRPWETDTIKEAVANDPQSTISDINKIILWRIWSRLDPVAAQVLLEVHDSVLFQCAENDIDTVREAFSYTPVEVPIHGQTMIIPAEAQIGGNWGDRSESNPAGLKTVRL
jgi:DNA polymerase I-like protein with 3'-5' exonuclease and polymerase domains